MSCLEFHAIMPHRALDCLEADEKFALERHLERCERCAAESRTRDDLMALLAEPVSSEPSLERLWEKVQRGIAAEPAPESASAARPVEVTIAFVCSFCHDALARNEACYCATCLAPHHEDCFRAHGRCSAYGCDETETVRPRRDEVPLPRPRRSRRRFLVALPLLAGAAVAAVAARPHEKARVVTFQKGGLREAVAAISEQARTPIFVDPAVDEKAVLAVQDRPWRQALEDAARATKCVVRPLGDGALVLEQPPCVTLQFSDANVRTILQLLAAYGRKNILIGPEVQGTVSLDVHDVPWDKALRTITTATGDYVAARRGELVAVMPRSTHASSPWGTEDLEAPLWPLPLDPKERPPSRLDLDAEKEEIRSVVQRIAKAAGRSIDVAPNVSGSVTVHARDTSWRALLAFACRAGDFRVRESGDSLRVEALPRQTLQFTDAPVRPVLQLLATHARMNIVLSPEVTGNVTLDLHAIPYEEAIFGITHMVGDYECVQEAPDLLRIVPRSTVQLARPRFVPQTTSRTRPLAFAGGRTVEIAFEGVLMGPQGAGATRAVFSGRVYEKGDVLRDAGGRSLGIQIAEIGDGEAVLEDLEDPSHPRATVKVGK